MVEIENKTNLYTIGRNEWRETSKVFLIESKARFVPANSRILPTPIPIVEVIKNYVFNTRSWPLPIALL